MPKKRKSGKTKKNKGSAGAYLILVGLAVLMGYVVLGSQHNTQSYAFCEKLKELNESTDTYAELKDQLKKLCDVKELSPAEQEAGNLSVEFINNLLIFNNSWKENESIAKEYAQRIDRSYIEIEKLNVNPSEIKTNIIFFYSTETDSLLNELNDQHKNINNITFSIEQLKEKNNNLTDRLERTQDKGEMMNEQVKKLSLIYNQRTNELNNIESSLSLIRNEYENVKSSFNSGLFPFLLIGFTIGSVIGIVLSLRWKKERSYWDAYTSSAKVSSPLKIAAMLTGILIASLFLYLFLSGKLELILTVTG